MSTTMIRPIADLTAFVRTRDGLHRVAEHVLAPARYADDREIRLTAFPGGFATPVLSDGRRVSVVGTRLVIDDGAGPAASLELDTIGMAAAFAGVEAGFPSSLYEPATTFVSDDPLMLDAAAANVLAAWFALTADVIAGFAAELVDASPSPLVLWPEHFDQAIFTEDDDEMARANYGASPGDDGHPEPYLYVGPWSTPAVDPFWNATHFTGALLPLSVLADAADPAHDALEFLRAGRRLLAPHA